MALPHRGFRHAIGLYIGSTSVWTSTCPFARVWACWYANRPPRTPFRGSLIEDRHAHTRATGMPSVMPR